MATHPKSRRALAALFLAAAAPFAAAQTGTVALDVGLTLDGGMLTVIYGQQCGPFACQPLPAGPLGRGQPRVATVHGAPGQLFALFAGLPTLTTPCVTLPGVANALLLGQPVTLALGLCGSAPGTAACPVGPGAVPITIPPAAPPGLSLLLQGAAFSPARQRPAFTIALLTSIV